MQAKKQGRGRPKGKKIDWSGVMWRSMTDAQIADKVGTSIPNVWMRRKRMIKDGKQVAYQGAKFSRYNPETKKSSPPARVVAAKKAAKNAARRKARASQGPKQGAPVAAPVAEPVNA